MQISVVCHEQVHLECSAFSLLRVRSSNRLEADTEEDKVVALSIA